MSANTCVCCGAIIPEGRQVCLICEALAEHTPLTSTERGTRFRENRREDYNAYHRDYYAQHREEINAKRRAKAERITIVRCRDCKYFGRIDRFKDGTVVQSCQMGYSQTPNGYCHRAKRKS